MVLRRAHVLIRKVLLKFLVSQMIHHLKKKIVFPSNQPLQPSPEQQLRSPSSRARPATHASHNSRKFFPLIFYPYALIFMWVLIILHWGQCKFLVWGRDFCIIDVWNYYFHSTHLFSLYSSLNDFGVSMLHILLIFFSFLSHYPFPIYLKLFTSIFFFYHTISSLTFYLSFFYYIHLSHLLSFLPFLLYLTHTFFSFYTNFVRIWAYEQPLCSNYFLLCEYQS